MENVKFVEIETAYGETQEHAIIDHEDGSLTSMTKAEYDRRQAEHLTEIPTV